MSQYLTTEERVAQGVALLDTVRPGWIDEIDLDYLDMSEPGYCVLGQVFGEYTGTIVDLSGIIGTGDDYVESAHARDVWAVAHGFEIPFNGTQRSYDRLEAVWRGIIEDRLAERVSRGAPLN